MKRLKDTRDRLIRLTTERQDHIERDHPEMAGQVDRIRETLLDPDLVVRSKTDPDVELVYRHYPVTPVTEKYLCIVVKTTDDAFIVTTYYTNRTKRGEVLWGKQ